MIKQVMNKTYVPSSSHAFSAEELIKGSLKLTIDSISKYFCFNSVGSDFNPIYIDPENRALLNVKSINGVDVSKLIGGIIEGYGIIIDKLESGVYKVNVKEGLFALKSDLDATNRMFENYTTTADLKEGFPTKNDLKLVDEKFENYTTTIDLQTNYLDKSFIDKFTKMFEDYALNSYVDNNFVTKNQFEEKNTEFDKKIENTELKFNDYTTTVDLEENYLKKGDIISDDKFTKEEGFDYFTVKNENISVEIEESNINASYNVLKINLPEEIKTKILNSTFKKITNIFKFTIRKKLIFKFDGTLITEFISYVNNGTIFNPIITSNLDDGCCNINYEPNIENEFHIAFDRRMDFNPYELYMNGELSIMYLLSQDALVSSLPTIRCDIIEAKNALKLHESDVHYFYKPDVITEEKIDEIDYFKMIYKIPEDYVIPFNLDFKFTEYCFGNHWNLTWDGEKWNGKNCKGKINGKIINKCNLAADEDAGHNHGSHIMIKRELNEKFIKPREENSNLMFWMLENSVDKIDDKERPKIYVVYKNGTMFRAQSQEEGKFVSMSYRASTDYKIEGYDLLTIQFQIEFLSKSLIDPAKIQYIYLDIPTENSPDCINRFTFSVDKYWTPPNGSSDRSYLTTDGVLDTLEKLNLEWGKSEIKENSRDIELYLRKDYTDPIEEVNWDSSTNAFKYIINQQFYEITPNPNAVTTLYTDFNITSSKIITADNITTMRADLNLVTNNVDIMSYDVKDALEKVEYLNSDMIRQKQKTQYIECELNQVKITANAALIVGSLALGLSITNMGITFASNIGSQTLRGLTNKVMEGGYEPIVEAAAMAGSMAVRSLSITSTLEPLKNWCEQSFEEINLKDEDDERVPTFSATFDLCHQFIHKLKPSFKLLTNAVENISGELDFNNNQISDQILNLDTKINETINNHNTLISNCITYDELTRRDIIDFSSKVENNLITLESEDLIDNGILIFKIFVLDRQKNFYIKFENGLITEFKGLAENIEINGEIIKMLADSKTFREQYLDDPILENNVITINCTYPSKISGVMIQGNSCGRTLSMTVSDFAYLCDIEALNKKIEALAINSHTNDAVMTTALEEIPTIDEVNEVLKNYVQIKELPPIVDLSNYVSKAGNSIIEGKITISANNNVVEKTGILHTILTNTNLPQNSFIHAITNIAPNLSTGTTILNYFGKNLDSDKAAYFGYKEPGEATFGIWTTPNIITFTKSRINLNKPTTIKLTGSDYQILNCLKPSLTSESGNIAIYLGKSIEANHAASFSYNEPGIGSLGIFATPNIIQWNKSSINLNKNTAVIGKLTVNGNNVVTTNELKNVLLAEDFETTENEESLTESTMQKLQNSENIPSAYFMFCFVVWYLNTVLQTVVFKEEIEKFREKSDLKINSIKKLVKQNLEINTGIYCEVESSETSFVEFHEGAHLVGFDTFRPAEIIFDIIFKTVDVNEKNDEQGKRKIHYCADVTTRLGYVMKLGWDELNGALFEFYEEHPITITLAEFDNEIEEETNDQIALKSELDDFETRANTKFYHASQMNLFNSSINNRFATKTEVEEKNSELRALIQELSERITRLEKKILE